ncbi:MAG: acyl-CoA thioesterase [Haloechinothrix sp.]
MVAKHQISYLRPLVYRQETARVETTVARIGRSSVTVEHVIRDDQASYCRAVSVLVAFDAAAGVARAFTDAERAVLEKLP